ncbi:acyl-CoA synthetase [Novosphingobium bradum]|uniref:Acyl-CoA synthetase n=1 Tax=Novosphingobium bradum TaxID=1737444 RepID=A0ABV7IQ15_9SPHN
MYPGIYAKTTPDKPAAIRPATGEVLTYAELDDRSNRLAHLLRAHGVERGGHVAMFVENSLIYFDVIWACLRAGLYVTPINTHQTAENAAYVVDDCDATVLIASAALPASAELGRLSPRCTLKLAVGGALDGFADYETSLAGQPASPIADESIGSMMLYSSGTTGRPKGILRPLIPGHPADGIPAVRSRPLLFGFDSSTVYLSTAPMYHGAPFGTSAGVQSEGGTVVLMERFDGELALRLIEEYRITHSQWVPTMFIRMLKLPDEIRTRHDLSSHRSAIHAAAPCPIEVKRAMIDWWGPIIDEYYSSSENTCMTLIGSADWLAHPGSVGRPRTNPIHVCDEEGHELPLGQPGLIYGELGAAAFRYHKDPAKTAEATHPFHKDWMTSGDVGYLDEDGFLYLTDRKAFLIISGGVNIYPQAIEDALALHPKVADVAVIGVPNADLGEEVKAVVQPAPGVEPSTEVAQELMDFVCERLGRQLTPRSVDFTEELPRLPTGKLAKKALRDSYWGGPQGATPIAARI